MGKLILLGMPIGNAKDVSPNGLAALSTADLIAAEDTRKFFRFAKELGIEFRAKVVAYHDFAEQDRIPELLSALKRNEEVVLLTDAGMPLVSDPGYRIVVSAISAGHLISVIPGPSAVTAALAVSGLPTARFCFEGFLSRKSGERRNQLTELKDEERTMVFFEAPHRLAETLADLVDIFGAERKGAICRELSKTYEQVIRGSLAELSKWASGEVKGEITLVISGCGDSPKVDLTIQSDQDRVIQLVLAHPLAKENRKSAVAAVASELNLSKREVYDLVTKSHRE
ncbi:MAG: 16S rRNA (cytidine(1402)-2'-O)-methyltransferase [Actinobacteria bacterium]|nr:16S rRNA (cytidine(1402)-2'-O)-methyltransferase [Actinomycetota bacterium]